MKNKKISVIIPTNNPGEYICELFCSLASQSLNPDLFEVLIILNGDISLADIISSYAIRYMPNCNTRLIVSDKMGVSIARNLGLEESIGEYIVFIDDDDLISSDYLSGLLENAVSDGIVVSDCRVFFTNERENTDSFLTTAYNLLNSGSNIKYRFRSLFSCVWGKLIPKYLIGNIRFNPNIFIGEDCCFMIALLPHVKQLIKADDNCIYYIRNRVGSASRKKKPFKKLLNNKIYQLRDYLGNIRFYNNTQNIAIFFNRIVSALLYWK